MCLQNYLEGEARALENPWSYKKWKSKNTKILADSARSSFTDDVNDDVNEPTVKKQKQYIGYSHGGTGISHWLFNLVGPPGIILLDFLIY